MSNEYLEFPSKISFQVFVKKCPINIQNSHQVFHLSICTSHALTLIGERTRRKLSSHAKTLSFLSLWADLSAVKGKLTRYVPNSVGLGGQTGLEVPASSF